MTGQTPEQIHEARLALAAIDPALARAHATAPPFEWRQRKICGYPGLVHLVVEQQLSIIAAAAIWKRLEEGLGEVTPRNVIVRDMDTLKAFGLSVAKARYARAIAEAVLGGRFSFEALAGLDDDAAVAALVGLKGIGRWTAEAYLMGCESRTDFFPAGDLGLREGLRMADGGAARLSEKALYARAEAWRPYRGVAAHLLWSYYGLVKRGMAQPAETGDSQGRPLAPR